MRSSKELQNQSLLNKKKLINKKQKRYLWELKINTQLNKQNLVFNLPRNWSFVLITNLNINTKKKHLYIYNFGYYFTLPVPTTDWYIYFDKNTSTINLSSIYKQNYTLTYWTHLKYLFDAFNRPFFLKIKFKGKGYYIFKNKRNTITPQFGYAHRIYKYTFSTSVKFRTKTSIILFGLIKRDVLQAGFLIKSMRPINIFTGRGVRFSRQIIYKKTGKVSSYR